MKKSTRMLAAVWMAALPLTVGAAPEEGTFANCVVEYSGDNPFLHCGDEVIDIRRNFDGALERIKQRETNAGEYSGIFERYLRQLDAADQLRVEDLSELSNLIAISYPELYEQFVLDVSSAIKRISSQTLIQSEALVDAYKRFDASIGLEVPVPDSGDRSLGDIIRAVGEDNFIVSAATAEIMAYREIPPIIEIMPLTFSSLNSVLFHAHDVNGVPVDDVDADSTFHFEGGTFCTNPGSTCIWPAGFDYVPYENTLVWKSTTLSPAEVEAIVTENEFRMTLSVNGTELILGPPSGDLPFQGYYASVVDTATAGNTGPDCPAAAVCIATTIFRDRLKQFPQPWRITFRVDRVLEHDPPIPIFDEASGNIIDYVYSLELFSSDSQTIASNGTYGQSFFVEAISSSFKSDRCMDCHGFGTPEALALHHGFGGTQGTAEFIDMTTLELEPSAYVPGAHVMTCNSCHVVPATDFNGNPFNETEWKAPYFDLDIDWRSKSRPDICHRVLQNLPTHSLRAEHFREDGRLFWAVASPMIMGTVLEPQAYPFDYDKFLYRTLFWSQYIADCP